MSSYSSGSEQKDFRGLGLLAVDGIPDDVEKSWKVVIFSVTK
jgi:hypothetical protein